MPNRNRPLLFLCLLLCSWQMALAQETNPTIWPYGGIPDTSRKSLWRDKPSLNFPHRANFHEAKFSQPAYFGEAKFDSTADFTNVTFSQDALFLKDTFLQNADFSWATFSREAVFMEAKFNRIATFLGVTFSQDADFRKVKFDSTADFNWATFSQDAYFDKTTFSQKTNWGAVKFNNTAHFFQATFLQIATFYYPTFTKDADFRWATFKEIPEMEGCKFGNILLLGYTNFEKGADLRRARFDLVQSIYVNHHTTFPVGKLYLYWEQFQGKNYPRIKLDDPPRIHSQFDSSSIKDLTRKISDIDSVLALRNISGSQNRLSLKRDSLYTILKSQKKRLDNIYRTKITFVNNEHYQRLETFYHRLRDNFLAQGDKASADAVMYELGWQKREIYGFWSWPGFWQTLYYWFFGYGYQPWRFLLYLVLPCILLFAVFWYCFYYHRVAPIVEGNMPKEVQKTLQSPASRVEKTLFKTLKVKIYDHAAIAGQRTFLARAWQVVFFSTSVLLGIRFKREWIEGKDKVFLSFVTFQWLLGISLYVAFALLVKSNQFAYIKGLLGF